MKEEKIYLDQQGYNELLKKIEELKIKIQENNSGRKNAFDAGAGDGWDSPEFEEIERKERMLVGELNRLYAELSKVEIVERKGALDIIDIGDIIKVEISSVFEQEEEIFKLIGGTANMNFNNEIQEISINSPMGTSIYKKRVGDSASYSVNGTKFTILIKEKLNSIVDSDNICLSKNKTK